MKNGKVTNNKGATSSNSNKEDLKMTGIHPDFVEVIRDPFCKNEIFKFTPRSIDIESLYVKFIFAFLLPILVCYHNNAIVMIVFFIF